MVNSINFHIGKPSAQVAARESILESTMEAAYPSFFSVFPLSWRERPVTKLPQLAGATHQKAYLSLIMTAEKTIAASDET